MDLVEKLKILSDAAKYDVSCSSSGSKRSAKKNGIGNASNAGICHSWSEDGRCISLLKILLTNYCIYDCEYCINRRSNDTIRAIFTPREIADLTIDFYKRNYIEGLFLSSGIIRNPDYTMEQLIETARILRYEKNFNGYIHMKAIPGASKELIETLGRLIDRASINIELPTDQALSILAPEKKIKDIYLPMKQIEVGIHENAIARKQSRKAPSFIPAGQTTQMIVGASREDDKTIIQRAETLYHTFSLKRVYYSSYVPVVASKLTEGIVQSPLIREHRLYQADFLMRYYGFVSNEILTEQKPNFDLEIDPKANWALQNIHLFPIEINKASYEDLLRVPGFGPAYAKRIIRARSFCALSYDDLQNMKISTKRAKNFITVNGIYRGASYSKMDLIRLSLMTGEVSNRHEQLSLFGGNHEIPN